MTRSMPVNTQSVTRVICSALCKKRDRASQSMRERIAISSLKMQIWVSVTRENVETARKREIGRE